jgi:hypothetical protein
MVREEGTATFLNHGKHGAKLKLLKLARNKLSIWEWLIYQIAVAISVN